MAWANILVSLSAMLMLGAVLALLVAGYFWAKTQQHLKPELQGKIVFRGLRDTLNPAYYGSVGLKYRRRTLWAYGLMWVLLLLVIILDLVGRTFFT